jgi:hypothetical protein
LVLLVAGCSGVWAQQRAYRLPATDLKQPIIWGAVAEAPDGRGLTFGGQDQTADDGRGHTRLRVRGTWQTIAAELRKANPWQKWHDRAGALRQRQKEAAARARSLYFQGRPEIEQGTLMKAELLPLQAGLVRDLHQLVKELTEAVARLGHEAAPVRDALHYLNAAEVQAKTLNDQLTRGLSAAAIQGMNQVQILLEKAAEVLDAEPPARALSPLVYDPKSQVFVLFGGDHLDYLTNDTWVFDLAKRRWQRRRPATAPLPRASHTWQANRDGTVTLSGGYTYTSNTDYLGGQYRDLGDGSWTYDIATNAWTGSRSGLPPDTRIYRAGPFHPDFFLQGPRPDARSFADWLAQVPANTWVQTKPPQLPQLNRDWGTAVLDPDRDLILRWSGGHSAHGGTDVLHFHLASNRWELPFPVEFPLGQLYANTSYPDGWNFNRRPWITGHTYQNYGYEALTRKMYFLGRPRYVYLYDPDRGDWISRVTKPADLSYANCFYTLTVTATPHGLVCWTEHGRLFHHRADRNAWEEVKLRGDNLPGAVVDNSTVVFDSRRDRLLFFRKLYGEKSRYDGQIHVVDWRTRQVRRLTPKGSEAAVTIPYLCQIHYDAGQDVLLVGATLPPDADGCRRTPVYDCATNRWQALKLAGDDPSGKTGRNVSLGLLYDARRRLFWAVDAQSRVFVLRLDVKTADSQDLRLPEPKP